MVYSVMYHGVQREVKGKRLIGNRESGKDGFVYISYSLPRISRGFCVLISY